MIINRSFLDKIDYFKNEKKTDCNFLIENKEKIDLLFRSEKNIDHLLKNI